MRTIKRTVVVNALALPLTLGTAGIASADTGYNETGTFAGADGAGSYSVSAQADGNSEGGTRGGGTSFEESSSFAGPDGAFNEYTRARAHGDGGTSFEQDSSSANADGASSNNVSSSAGAHGDNGDVDEEQGLLGGLLSL
jgi:hypothetical protein